jgi:cysteine desulfurase
MLPFLSDQQGFGNANSGHFYGREAARAIEQARAEVAGLIKAKPADIIFTSGATEANNLAIKGLAQASHAKGKHIITSQIEHSAVLETCGALAQAGFSITYLPPENNGLLDVNKLQQALRPDTILVSIMHVNNELGVVQDLAAIGQIVRQSTAYFHVDAVQSAGKLPLDLQALPVDLMSFSAHKLYGPKGVGALYLNQDRINHLQPLFHGGGQERGLRPGTLATHQIVGMGAAFAIAQAQMAVDNKRIADLSARLWQGIQPLGEVYLNGDALQRVPAILNIGFVGVAAHMLLPALKDLAVATGSACHEGRAVGASHVLQAIGLADTLINNSIRFSLGRFTTENEIDFALDKISAAVKLLRTI